MAIDLGQQVGLVALGSGLIGALLTAFLNYAIRLQVASRLQKKKEQQLAYVHLVQLSELLATEIVIKDVLGPFARVLSDKINEFNKEHSDHDFSHRLCVELAKIVKEIEPDRKQEVAKVGPLTKRLLEAMLTRLERFRLSPEQLTQLPREATLSYQKFSYLLESMRLSIVMWTDAAESGNFEILTADMLHAQWLSIKAFTGAAKELWTTLVIRGKLSSSDAGKLLETQVALVRQQTWAMQTSRLKMKAAIETAEREVKSKAAAAT